MLNHPWLNMGENAAYKYTEKEYEVMMLKKEIKEKIKGGKQGGGRGKEDSDGEHQDMGELIDSDDYLNEADGSFESYDEDDNEESSDEEGRRDNGKERAKINNSFTGPYPLDPTEFKHTDKGPNQQFEQLL